HVAAAYGRLERVATAAEAAGDRATALAAWRGIRSSVLATRSFFTPHADRKAVADRHIAALMAAEPVWGQPAPAGADPDPSWRAAPDAGDTAEARQAFYARQLARDDAPSLAWVAIALAGFGLWIGGAIHFARRGLDDAERLDRRVAGAAGGLVLLGLVVWVVGLYNA
ncbi:MAG: hypothetical protein KC464_25965, partial [Myxococcales bacterium]|nr:hypothetical protein [Myxococcales bacterium]